MVNFIIEGLTGQENYAIKPSTKNKGKEKRKGNLGQNTIRYHKKQTNYIAKHHLLLKHYHSICRSGDDALRDLARSTTSFNPNNKVQGRLQLAKANLIIHLESPSNWIPRRLKQSASHKPILKSQEFCLINSLLIKKTSWSPKRQYVRGKKSWAYL